MRWVHVLAVLGTLVLVGLTVLLFADPPAVVPADAPADVFSAARAMEDVRGLTSTGKPHPAGTYDGTPRTAEQIADHTRAREYVEGRLRDLGLSPAVQKGHSCRTFREITICADVENVVARVEGTEPGPAVMLVAHYDSTPLGPGAADDGAGVATILETVRALRTGPAPKRTLVVLIDDGEEMGLQGARVFSNEHPWAKDVGVVLNFEARGTAGQTAMFETSADNGALIGLFGRAVDRPVASSLIYTMYKRLPNDTDLSVFKEAGMAGYNFAFADRVYNYHTPNDTAEELDPRSVQHMGDQALAVTRALLAADSLPPRAGDAVYFDVFTLGLVRYPASLGGPLALIGAAASVFVVGLAIRRRRTSLGRVLIALAVWLGALVASAAGGIGLGLLLRKIRFPDVGSGPMAMRALMADRHTLGPWIALVALSAAVSAAIALWLCPRTAAEAGAKEKGAKDWLALAGGALSLWTVLSVVLGFLAPGAAYLFTFPAAFGATALGHAAREGRRTSWQIAGAAALAAAPAAVLWFPVMRVFLIMVGSTMPPATTLPVFLMASLVTPLLAASEGRVRWGLPVTAGALSAGAAMVACFLR